MKEKPFLFLYVLVAVSLVLNIAIFARMYTLENRLSQRIWGIPYPSDYSYEIGALQQQLNQIFEEVQWISDEVYLPDQSHSSPQEIHLNLEWNFLDLERDAEVYLMQRSETDREWNRVSAQSLGGTAYRALLLLSPGENYEYQIVAEGSSLRSSKPVQVPERYYKPGQVFAGAGIRSEDRNNITMEVQVYEEAVPHYPFYQIRSANVSVYKAEWTVSGYVEGDLLQTVALEISSDRVDGYNYDFANRNMYFAQFQTPAKQAVLLYLVIEYADGRTDEGQLYPHRYDIDDYDAPWQEIWLDYY